MTTRRTRRVRWQIEEQKDGSYEITKDGREVKSDVPSKIRAEIWVSDRFAEGDSVVLVVGGSPKIVTRDFAPGRPRR